MPILQNPNSPTPQNPSYAGSSSCGYTVTTLPNGGVQVSGQALVSPGVYTTMADAAPAMASRHEPTMKLWMDGAYDINLQFTTCEGGQLINATFEPDIDMTAHDIMNLTLLTTYVSNNGINPADIMCFIRKKSLERHFRMTVL